MILHPHHLLVISSKLDASQRDVGRDRKSRDVPAALFVGSLVSGFCILHQHRRGARSLSFDGHLNGFAHCMVATSNPIHTNELRTNLPQELFRAPNLARVDYTNSSTLLT